MVAITVILAAVIGTFVLGLGDQVSQTAPQATVNFELVDGTVAEDATEPFIDINHRGGDPIPTGDLSIKISGPSGSVTLWDGSATGSGIVGTGSSSGTATSHDLTVSMSAPSGDFTTTDTLTIDVDASDDGADGTAETVTMSGSYTVTLVDKPSGQIIAEDTVDT